MKRYMILMAVALFASSMLLTSCGTTDNPLEEIINSESSSSVTTIGLNTSSSQPQENAQ